MDVQSSSHRRAGYGGRASHAQAIEASASVLRRRTHDSSRRSSGRSMCSHVDADDAVVVPARRDRLLLIGATLAGAMVVVGAVIAGASGGSSSPPLAPADLSGELTGRAPWPRNTAGLRARLQALGLPALAQEGTVLHIHQHLDLYVNGRRVTVPAGIGIDDTQGFISPLTRMTSPGSFTSSRPTCARSRSVSSSPSGACD